MASQMDQVPRESVIVVMDAHRNKGVADALDWALKHVVRPKDTGTVIGVLGCIGKKNSSCFPINIRVGFSGIWDKLEFSSGHAEVNPRELEEEIERKREQYQASLQPFYRQCKRNEVKLEVKLAAGICPKEITTQEALKSNARWIVLDSQLKQHKLFIYGHVECNVAVMKGQDVATLMPSRAPKHDYSSASCGGADDEARPDNQPLNDQKNENSNVVDEGEQSMAMPPPPQGSCWYPLQWRSGFPQDFSLTEIEVITNGFADIVCDYDHSKVYEGVLQNTPVIVKSFQDDERFWSMLAILSRVRHRNIMNFVGYCCSSTNRLLVYDYPCLSNVARNLECDASASNLPWRARWRTAMEIGGSLRYLHEECPNGPIVHQSVCSTNILYSHGCSAMLSNFITAKWLKDDVPCNGNSTIKCPNIEKGEQLSVDVHDYEFLLVELITGKVADSFPHENEGQTLIDWALPFLESCSVTQMLDPRLTDNDDDSRVVHCMARVALLCLENDLGRSFSISEVLAVVRGDQPAIL